VARDLTVKAAELAGLKQISLLEDFYNNFVVIFFTNKQSN
jgi:hypothetical protein